MKTSIKERAGISDTLKIFEGLHLRTEFIENMADGKKKEMLDPDCVREGDKHFRICERCLQELVKQATKLKDQNLPL